MARQKRKRSRKTAGKKNPAAKTRPERGDKKKTSKLSREYDEKMKEMQRDGIIILVDQPNLHYSFVEWMKKKGKKVEREKCQIDYDGLKATIARGGSSSKGSSKPRNVLKTILVSSEKSRVKTGFQIPRGWKEKKGHVYLESPVRARNTEKAVDSILVREIVEEYMSLEMIRLLGKKVPRRTFCIVSADSDFVDVVNAAVGKGFDVEVWPFRDLESFSDRLWKFAGKCESSSRCGRFKRNDLGKHDGKIAKCRGKDKTRSDVKKDETRRDVKKDQTRRDVKKDKTRRDVKKDKTRRYVKKAPKSYGSFQKLDTAQVW